MKTIHIFLLLVIGVFISFITGFNKKVLNWFVINLNSGKMKNFGLKEGAEAILEVQKIYGSDMARIVEKMFRLETNHFKSGQYKNTGSAGMETGKWSSINPSEVEAYTYKAHDSNLADGIDEFIVWKHPKYAALYLADYIKRHNGNYARWYSLNETSQQNYRNKINQIQNKIV